VEMPSLSDFLHAVWEATSEVEYPRIPSQVFKFAREAKGQAGLADLEALDAADAIETILETWDEADPDDPWNVFADSVDARAEFITIWDKIKYPPGTNILNLAADATENAPPLKPKRLYSKKYAQFLGIAAQLQIMRPNIGIKLPVEALGKILGCDYSMVCHYRKFAEKERILEKTKAFDRKAHQASEFIFNLELFDLETGEQVKDPIPPTPPTPTPSHSYERQEKQERHETKETQEDLRDIRDLRKSEEDLRKCAFASQSARAFPARRDDAWENTRRQELARQAIEASRRFQ
jgi:hypothetical protein